MSDTEWVAITAGPAAGKSTTINALSYAGYRTTPEVARLWMDELISVGEDVSEYVGTEPFQRMLIDEQLALEQRLDETERYYLDRTLLDTVVYTEFFGYDVPEIYYDFLEDRYDAAYVLEQLPFNSDYARHEDEQQAREIHCALEKAYKSVLTDVEFVPVTAVSERVEQITGDPFELETTITALY